MHSTSNPNSSTSNRFGLAAAVFSLVLAVFVFAGVVSASEVAATTSKPAAQATTAPPPQGTVEVPNAIATGPAAPGAVATGPAAPGAVTTGEPATGTGTTGTGTTGTGTPATATGVAASQSTTSGSSFPWLLLVLLLVILALIIVAFVLLRGRRSPLATSTVTSAPAVVRTEPVVSSAVTSTTPANTTTATTTAVTTPPAVPPATSAVAPAALAAAASTAATPEAVPAAGVALPATLTCPNCSTVNQWDENFCHECGQDLRPLRASMIAAAAPPPDIVTDDMPYLETLDRTDEQLEYVLSRKTIVIGTAAGNDIVIDSAFKGNDTVSPKHAELRREGNSFLLVDLNSENGTYVNDARTGENLLSEGDQIRFGSVRFIYRVP